MVDDGFLIGFEDSSGNFVEVGRFNNTANDVTQPLEIKHANSGERITLDSSGFETSGDIVVGGSVQNADEINFSNLSTNPSQFSLADVWFRSDTNQLLIETGNGLQVIQTSSLVPDTAVTSGLVAWYRFEDSANTAIDATNALGVGADQTAFDGSTVNGASFVENGGVRDVVSGTGANSGAYDFDGTDDFISVPNPIAGAFDYSWMGWVNTSQSVTDSAFNLPNMIGTIQSGGNSRDHLLAFDAGLPRAFFESNSNVTTINATSLINDSNPNHVAVTVTETSVSIYVNGVEENTKTVKNDGLSSADLEIARANFSANRHFDGIIDDVRIYNRSLSASEINQIYQNTDPDQ
jgi:hypothetical protein